MPSKRFRGKVGRVWLPDGIIVLTQDIVDTGIEKLDLPLWYGMDRMKSLFKEEGFPRIC